MTPPPTIVVIDDNVNLAWGFALALQQAGYRVHTAHSAEDGLALVQREQPAAIVLDFRMPFINGAGFLYRLREAPAHTRTPVLVVTAAAVDDEMRSELTNLRAIIRFKPLGMAQLLAEVNALLAPAQPPPASTNRLSHPLSSHH